MNELDSWGLVQQGYFEQACEKAMEEYNSTGRTYALRHKLYALFHLRRYEECVALTSKIIDIENGISDYDFMLCGVATWALGRRVEAINVWQRGKRTKYSDAAGGVELRLVLYFASIAMRDKKSVEVAKRDIAKILKTKRSINWPGPLAGYALGVSTKQELIDSVTTVDILRQRQLCQRDFVLGLKELEINNIDGWKQKLAEAVSHGPSSYLEPIYYLAEVEFESYNHN